MKKLLALLLILVMCVGVLVACKPDEVEGPSLDQAKEYLNGIMKDGNGKATPNDYDVVGKVIIEGTSFEVTWTTNKENITVKPSSKANLWTIDVPEVNAEELTYEITATIKNAAGESVQVTFNKVLPVLDSTGIVTAPVEGTNYKLFLEQVNLGYTLYAKAESQDGQNKYILTTLDPKEAADFQVEVVDGGYKIFTMIDGVKNYVHAKGVDNNGKVSKYIGFATESDVVYKFNAEINTFVVDIDGIKYGVGTYNAFETISISEITYFNSGNINVEGGQFPVGFMLSSYAETLQPDEKPVASDPTPDSTLTIEEAIELGNTKVKDQYTEGKYYVTGVITEVYNDQYGNMYITDGNGNTLTIYGTYGADGSVSYKDLTVKPVAGDTITVYGIIGKYNDPQMKNGWITAHTPGEGGGETPDPTPTLGVVDPVVGTAYKFGMVQGNLNNAIYYLAGGMDGYYMATTTDASKALDVYLEETTGGYYLYCFVGETKTYINMVVSDDGQHVNGAYEATASTVYTYDATSKTIKAVVNDTDYWFGTRNDKTYTTMGPCAVSYNGFYGQFYGASEGGETPVECEHEYVDGVCTKCGAEDPDYVAPSEHVCADADGNFVCDEASCGKTVLPAADSTLTIEQALALGNLYAKDAYTADKYYVTGTIKNIYNTTHGNMYIVDENGNELCVYGSYDATGANKYPAAATKWVAGDTVTVYGVIGKYNDPQMKNGWVTVNSHEHAYADATCEAPATCPCGATQGEALPHTWADATCTAPKTCSVCGAKEGEALGHTYVEGVCSVCGHVEGEEPAVLYYVLKGTSTDGTVYYWNGAAADGKGSLTTNASQAVQLVIEEVTGGVYVYYTDSNGAKQYITIGTKNTGFGISTTATVINYDATNGYLHANDRYVSTYGVQDIRTYNASNIPGSNGANFYLVMTVV